MNNTPVYVHVHIRICAYTCPHVHIRTRECRIVYEESLGPAGEVRAVTRENFATFLYEKSFNLKTIPQGDFGHFRENILIMLSKVAKIALRGCF